MILYNYDKYISTLAMLNPQYHDHGQKYIKKKMNLYSELTTEKIQIYNAYLKIKMKIRILCL